MGSDFLDGLGDHDYGAAGEVPLGGIVALGY